MSMIISLYFADELYSAIAWCIIGMLMMLDASLIQKFRVKCEAMHLNECCFLRVKLVFWTINYSTETCKQTTLSPWPKKGSRNILLSIYSYMTILCNVYCICMNISKRNHPNPDVQTEPLSAPTMQNLYLQ